MATQKILVTGATDGIGKQTALDLANKGYTLVIHGRSEERTEKTRKQLQHTTGNEAIHTLVADFNSLKQVGDMAAQINSQHPDLKVLINNAGVFQTKREFTEDGFEKSFGINHLAVVKLTLSVLETLKANAPSRVVTVASMAHQWGTINFNNLNAEQGFDAHEVYSMAKLCNVLFTYKLAEKLEGTGVTSNCLHPGVISTKLLHAGWGGGLPVEQGSRNSVYVATAPELENVNSKYFTNKREASSNSITYDKSVQDKLWQISLEMLNMADPLA